MFRSQLRRPYTDVPFYVDGYGLGWFTGHYRGTRSGFLGAPDSLSHTVGQLSRVTGKERKGSIYIPPFMYYVYLKALMDHSFYLKIHNACLSLVSVTRWHHR